MAQDEVASRGLLQLPGEALQITRIVEVHREAGRLGGRPAGCASAAVVGRMDPCKSCIAKHHRQEARTIPTRKRNHRISGSVLCPFGVSDEVHDRGLVLRRGWHRSQQEWQGEG